MDYVVLSMASDGPAVRGDRAERAPLTVETIALPTSAAATEFARDESVQAMAPVVPMRLVAPTRVTSVSTIGRGSTWGIRAVGADRSSSRGRAVRVAVLDTGIDAAHPTFADVDLVYRNFTTDVDDDIDGHGTHCAATIFGGEVDGLRIGVAPGIERAYVAKVIGTSGARSDDIVRAIHWASEQGADVVSMSLGIDFPGLVDQLLAVGYDRRVAVSLALEGYLANVDLYRTLLDHLGAASFFGHGSVVVAAAGNESERAGPAPVVLNAAPPAVAQGVVAVGAAGRSEAGLVVAPFSNAGPTVMGPGVEAISAAVGGGLRSLDGTSMATPHVAGVAALWAEQLVRQTGRLLPNELRARLLGSATTAGFSPGAGAGDIGLGIVQAPV